MQPGPHVYVEVEDSGIGMDPETQRRMFDPFFSTKFSGSGLGLSAVLGIVQGHAGGIRVDSELGRGTRVRVAFPASAKQLERDADPARPRTGIPADARAFYEEVFQKVHESPEWKEYTQKKALNRAWLTGDELMSYFVDEREKHRGILKAAGEIK